MESGILHSFISTLELHPYAFLFVGLLFAGETLLLPAIYLSFTDELSLTLVVATSVLATTIADSFWYFVGLHAKERFFSKMIEGRIKRGIERLSSAFSKRGASFLYLSKFVYGTRVVAQVLAGAERMPFRRYISVNFLGIVSLIGSIAGISFFVEESVESVGRLVHKAEVALLVLVMIVIASHLAIGAYINKQWSQR